MPDPVGVGLGINVTVVWRCTTVGWNGSGGRGREEGGGRGRRQGRGDREQRPWSRRSEQGEKGRGIGSREQGSSETRTQGDKRPAADDQQGDADGSAPPGLGNGLETPGSEARRDELSPTPTVEGDARLLQWRGPSIQKHGGYEANTSTRSIVLIMPGHLRPPASDNDPKQHGPYRRVNFLKALVITPHSPGGVVMDQWPFGKQPHFWQPTTAIGWASVAAAQSQTAPHGIKKGNDDILGSGVFTKRHGLSPANCGIQAPPSMCVNARRAEEQQKGAVKAAADVSMHWRANIQRQSMMATYGPDARRSGRNRLHAAPKKGIEA
ncbi:hypothetical protein MAPG_04894 [Magnaporthiopsis poae ATCC 64411]|uniref:Uncharacterized protein n=1 Tax=Magnaporthiopsis poae (strain ATCC 64411 / 73-15) TaxID=644358 RepID=A0A0C4DXY7_MAGP6|nr:hypothetical protein MAPG_04894 [Magnaporthiopsis poae ATCC 64411]